MAWAWPPTWSWPWTLAVLVVVLSALWFHNRRSRRSTGAAASSAVPWPAHLPGDTIPAGRDAAMGNFPELTAAGTLIDYLHALHKRHGPVASFWFGTQRVVSVANALSFLATARLFDRPAFLYEAVVPMITPRSIQVSNGADARSRRTAYLEPPFTLPAVRATSDELQRVMREAVERLRTQNASAGTGGVALREAMLDVAIRGVGIGLFGPAVFRDDSTVRRITEVYLSTWKQLETKLGSAPPAAATSTSHAAAPRYAAQLSFADAVTAFQSDVMALVARCGQALGLDDDGKQQSTGSSGSTGSGGVGSAVNSAAELTAGSLVECMLRAIPPVDRATQMADAVTMLIAGFHTTANAMLWLLVKLAQHPTHIAHFRTELARVLATSTADGKASKSGDPKSAAAAAAAVPDVDAVTSALPYLRACIDETLRVCAVGPFAARFHPTEPVTLVGAAASAGGAPAAEYTVPPNTAIIQALATAQLDATEFADPLVFQPTRFLVVDAAQPTHPNGDTRYALLPRPSITFSPFGFAGKRQCPGIRYAYAAVAMCAAAVLQAFDIELVGDQPVELWYGLATTPKRDVFMRFKPRAVPAAAPSAAVVAAAAGPNVSGRLWRTHQRMGTALPAGF